MAQSNHHRPHSTAGDGERTERRNCGGARHPLLDPSALARRSLCATRPPVSAAGEPLFIRVRVRVRRASL